MLKVADHNWIVTGLANGHLLVIQIDNGEQLLIENVHLKSVYPIISLQSYQNQFMLTEGADGMIKVWKGNLNKLGLELVCRIDPEEENDTQFQLMMVEL